MKRDWVFVAAAAVAIACGRVDRVRVESAGWDAAGNYQRIDRQIQRTEACAMAADPEHRAWSRAVEWDYIRLSSTQSDTPCPSAWWSDATWDRGPHGGLMIAGLSLTPKP